MTKIYACLLGEWVCLNDDPECIIDRNGQSPTTWLKENSGVYAPITRPFPDTYEALDYVYIFYKGMEYRINPIFIQTVTA